MSYVNLRASLAASRVCSFDSNDCVMLFSENKYDDDVLIKLSGRLPVKACTITISLENCADKQLLTSILHLCRFKY